MDLDLSSDQELFLQTSSRFIESYPLASVREHAGTGSDAGPDYRRQAADLGWFSMLASEDQGGGSVSGNGLFDTALVALARGRGLQPGSFVGTNVAVHALSVDGSADQTAKTLPALMSGEEDATWVVGDLSGDKELGTGLSIDAAGARLTLNGSASLVQDADAVAWLLVTGTTGDGVTQVLVPPATPGVSIRVLDGLDLSRRFCEVTFDRVEVPIGSAVGGIGEAGQTAQRQLEIACILTAAESVGSMERDLAVAVQYAKDRIAFGRPIGSFQAIKHLLADTSLMLEMSKGALHAAAITSGLAEADSPYVASMVKAFVGDCGLDLAQNCFQVFGGIGYTWEHDQHLYLRRITTDTALYGDPTWHRERLCRLAGL